MSLNNCSYPILWLQLIIIDAFVFWFPVFYTFLLQFTFSKLGTFTKKINGSTLMKLFLKVSCRWVGEFFCFKMNFDVSFECCPWYLNKFAKTVLHWFQNIAGSEEKVTQRHTVEWAIILLVWNRHDDVHLNRVCTPKPSWMIRGSEIES